MWSILDDKLIDLIAEELNVRREDVTPALIQRMRDEDPVESFEFRNKFGGLNPRNESVSSKAELEEDRTRARKFWRKRSAIASR